MTDTTAPDAINQAHDIVTIDEIRAIFSSGTVPMEAAVAIQNATSPAALRAELREIAAAHRRLAAHGAGEGLREVERLRKLSDAATPGPWAWEQCGDKEDAPVVGMIYGPDNAPIAGEFEQPIDAPNKDYWRDPIFRDVHSNDGCSASANAAFAVAAVNHVRTLLNSPTDVGSTTREGGEGVTSFLTALADGSLVREILAAGAIIDVMTGGKFDWRARINDSDFTSSADWMTALEYARAALATTSSPDASPDSGEGVREAVVARPWSCCDAVGEHARWCAHYPFATASWSDMQPTTHPGGQATAPGVEARSRRLGE